MLLVTLVLMGTALECKGHGDCAWANSTNSVPPRPVAVVAIGHLNHSSKKSEGFCLLYSPALDHFWSIPKGPQIHS